MRVTRDALAVSWLTFFAGMNAGSAPNVVYGGHDTTAVPVVVFVLAVVIVPASVIIVLIDWNIGAIDAEELADEHLLGKLMYQLEKPVFCNKTELGDELRERPPRQCELEVTLSSDIFVVGFSCHWTQSIDVVIEAVQDAF